MTTPDDTDPAEEDDQAWRGLMERWTDHMREIDELKGRADE